MSKVDEIADAYEGTKDINDRAYLALVEMTVIARAYERELAKVKTERNVALAKVSKDGRRIAELEDVEERLLADLDALKAKLATIHKELGCELRDPNGTIWEHAAKVEQERDTAKAAQELTMADYMQMREMYDTACKERDALLAENKWHPASEPPNDNRDVWTTDGQGYYDSKNQTWWGNDGYGRLTSIFVTHWRELPKFKEEV